MLMKISIRASTGAELFRIHLSNSRGFPTMKCIPPPTATTPLIHHRVTNAPCSLGSSPFVGAESGNHLFVFFFIIAYVMLTAISRQWSARRPYAPCAFNYKMPGDLYGGSYIASNRCGGLFSFFLSPAGRSFQPPVVFAGGGSGPPWPDASQGRLRPRRDRLPAARKRCRQGPLPPAPLYNWRRRPLRYSIPPGSRNHAHHTLTQD